MRANCLPAKLFHLVSQVPLLNIFKYEMIKRKRKKNIFIAAPWLSFLLLHTYSFNDMFVFFFLFPIEPLLLFFCLFIPSSGDPSLHTPFCSNPPGHPKIPPGISYSLCFSLSPSLPTTIPPLSYLCIPPSLPSICLSSLFSSEGCSYVFFSKQKASVLP